MSSSHTQRGSLYSLSLDTFWQDAACISTCSTPGGVRGVTLVVVEVALSEAMLVFWKDGSCMTLSGLVQSTFDV